MKPIYTILIAISLTISIAFTNQLLSAQQDNVVTKLFDIEFAEISELSGVAKSAQYDDAFWVHNDSGDDARIFAIDSEGKVCLLYTSPSPRDRG